MSDRLEQDQVVASDPDGPAGEQSRLIAALCVPSIHGDGCKHVRVLETHISYVLLTGSHAYKIKKRVSLGFLDFTTLSARRLYCEEELRLNRRLAPALYLDVVPVTGTVDAPILGGNGPAIEYAVKMREFPQDALASSLLARGELGRNDIDTLAASVAAFHRTVDVAAADGLFGRPDDILRIARQNFAQIRPLLETPAEQADLDVLALWTEREYKARLTVFEERQRHGFVRECHGDLHVGNVARIDGEIAIFDCIEFNDAMRWIDVMSDVAFLVMDLQKRGHGDLGHRFLNAYLEISCDYAGLSLLRFYLVYRATVRAKVARVRRAQINASMAGRALLQEYRSYIDLALSYALPPRAAIIVTHGLAGSGKTTSSQGLLEALGAVRIRTDVERKRLCGLETRERSVAGIDNGIYDPRATEATYRRVCSLAREVASAGYIALVDATFLKRWQRDLFRKLAADLRIPFMILAFTATEPTLRERVAHRTVEGRDASDADHAVLDHQLRSQEPFAPEERAEVIACDTEIPLGEANASESWRLAKERLASARLEIAQADGHADSNHAR